ncbi:hypothetical protein PtA15_2A684 [Puccinia triticina]|uniref:Uncharacterized protein n=1 Tax=Puccinia triticina TaxID=208348 RepID=A0ABY7CEL3_9BASI|nr:uncharacterized protein PtA15_2A684 [Puccinia triticina]WAQ82367.1 hypothetical protein PtA15_2A684 [Puccinia triticina]
MISTDAHSRLARHLANLPEQLRPGFRVSAAPEDERGIIRQIDRPETVEVVGDLEVEQMDHEGQPFNEHTAVDDDFRMNYTDVMSEGDRASLDESSSQDNQLNMQEVIDIFKPGNRVDKDKESSGGQGEEPEEDGNDGTEDNSGWFPFGDLLVSHKSSTAGTFVSAGVTNTDGGFNFIPAAQPLVSVLLAGYMHNILSRTQYDKVKSLIELCGIKVRHWTSIWRTKKNIRSIL